MRTLIVLLALFLASCASSSLKIIDPPSSYKSSTIKIVPGVHELEIDKEDDIYFRKTLSENFYSQNRFSEGDDLILSYKYMHYDVSGRGGGPQRLAIIIEYVFSDASGEQISKIETRTYLAQGLQKGMLDAAIQVSDYAVLNFLD